MNKSPIDITIDKDNIGLLDFFISKIDINKEPQILHSFAPKITDERYFIRLK